MGLGTRAISCRLTILAHRGAEEERLQVEDEEVSPLLLMIGPSWHAQKQGMEMDTHDTVETGNVCEKF